MLHLWCEIVLVEVESLEFTKLRHSCSVEAAGVMYSPPSGTFMLEFQIQLPRFSALLSFLDPFSIWIRAHPCKRDKDAVHPPHVSAHD